MARVKARLLSKILVLLLAFIALVAGWGLRRIKDETQHDLSSSLETVLRTTQNGARLWALETKDVVDFWAKTPQVVQSLQHYLKGGERTDTNALNRLLLSVSEAHGYQGYFVLDRHGHPIAPANVRTPLGPAESRDLPRLLHQSVLGQPYSIRIDDKTDGILMTATAPIRDEQGRTIGILGFHVSPLRQLTSTVQLARLGDTGETYAFDRRGALLTESRFNEQLLHTGLIQAGEDGSLNLKLHDPGGNLLRGYHPKLPSGQQPLTEMARSATEGRSGTNVGGYRDYRGVEVAGAWTWDQELGIGLATEINLDDAYTSYRITRSLVLVMIGLATGGALLVLAYLWRQARVLAAIVDDLEGTKIMLQQSVEARNEFISIAAHELRTPLTSLRLQVELINQLAKSGQIASFPRDKLTHITEISSKELGRFAKLIQNLLDTSRVIANRIDPIPEKFDLSELVKSVSSRFLEEARTQGSSIKISVDPEIVGCWDRQQMEQVLVNLISNAIKYGDGKPIEIALQERRDQVALKVQDHGIGIRKEDQARIFDRFQRAGVLHQTAGLGLGLYIVRRIILDHHGEIRVESEPGKGSTFVVSLPRVVTCGTQSVA